MCAHVYSLFFFSSLPSSLSSLSSLSPLSPSPSLFRRYLKKLKKHSRALTSAAASATVIGGGGGGTGGGGGRGAKGGGGGGEAASAEAESTAESTVGSEVVAQTKIRVVFLSKCFTEDHSHGKLVAGVMRSVLIIEFKAGYIHYGA